VLRFLVLFYRAFILCIMIIRKMVVLLFMGVNYFTDEQLRLLEENPYVVKASKKSITYSEEFKELYWIDYQNGMQPIEIFKKYGFDPYALGSRRRDNFTNRLKKQAAREDGFKDTRSKNSGRPSTKELSLEVQLERLKHKNEVLQQENDFLKRVRFINRKQITKKSKNKQ
ncbi:HTH domain-containing protein, partial [Faecalibacillus intestinalis]